MRPRALAWAHRVRDALGRERGRERAQRRCGWLLAAALLLAAGAAAVPAMNAEGREDGRGRIVLPAPMLAGDFSVEQALQQRRSRREFANAGLTLAEVGQLLWAAQGVTLAAQGLRTAPSAGATYPLELLLVAGRVEGLEAGIYRYRPAEHALTLVRPGDRRADLARAGLGQAVVERAPATLAFAAVPERTTRRYGPRGERFIAMEVGHASQNVYLQAEALGLSTVAVGALGEEAAHGVLGLERDEVALYLMPVGR